MTNNSAKKNYKIVFVTCFLMSGLILLFILTSMFASNVPSGAICEDNVAYLQQGVDAYKEAFGKYPTDLKQLLETKQGKGPFVEKIDFRCPTDDTPYIVVNGKIQSGAK